jgi:predicted metal-dependent hydrolase
MHVLAIDEFQVEVDRKEIKNMHLSVYPPHGRIHVAAPSYVDDEAIRLFVMSRKPWILKQVRELSEQERESQRQFISGESHYLFGRRYILRVIDQVGPSKISVCGNTHIEFRVDSSRDRFQRETFFKEWYREQLREVVRPLVSKWSKELGVEVEDWDIRQMKTKWGSCNVSGKSLLFNLELAKQPYHCIEYIVVHELTHLIERNHNVTFFDLLKDALPNWEHRKAELNKRLPYVEFDETLDFLEPVSEQYRKGQPEV